MKWYRMGEDVYNKLSDNDTVCTTYKELLELIWKGSPIKNVQNICIDTSPKKIYKCPTAHENMINISSHKENANQNYNMMSLYIRMTKIKK